MQLVTGDPEGRAEAIAAATDEELLAAWELTGGEPGDPIADALAGEMQRRGLDF
jgi:hypothetical protein